MISISDIPAELKNDRLVTPFIARSVELSEVNPVVSYFCKLYVIEHILSKQLHTQSKEIENFTMSLLDDTEEAKSDPGDVGHVLESRQLSLNLVFVFAFKLFNGCLEDLSNYDGKSKSQLVQKLRASITFWSLFPLFKQGQSEIPLDFAKTTAGKCKSEEEFTSFTKEKLKTLKFQLSRLLKDEIPIKGEEQELAALAKEENGEESKTGGFEEDSETRDYNLKESDHRGAESQGGNTISGVQEDPEFPGSILPSTPGTAPRTAPGPKFGQNTENNLGPSSGNISESEEDTNFTLPGAPKFDPSTDQDSESAPFTLPGAPQFLPDDDLTRVNKKPSIHMYEPKDSEKKDSKGKEPSRPEPFRQRTLSSNVVHVTKDTLHDIIDTTEQVGKIQKHAKFAISALNYEDWATAEAELMKGLEMLKMIKEKNGQK